MAGIGGLSSGTALPGFGGLASGLDRDELIKNMTYGTRNKIAMKKQSQAKMKWQQEAFREITGKMHQLSQKYMSYSSSTNLLGSAMFSQNQITAKGANSKYIDVSGTASGATMSILGVKQMAQNTQMTTTGEVSNTKSGFETGNIKFDLDDLTDVNLISGETIYIEYGNKQYSVKLADTSQNGDAYNTAAGAAEAINKALSEVEIGNGKKLSDVLKVENGGDKFTFKKIEGGDTIGGTLKIAGGTGDVLENLGFLKSGEDITELSDSRITITKDGLTSVETAKLKEEQSIAKQLGGKSISFQYNGTTKWIELPEEDDLKGKDLKFVQEELQKKLDEAFGAGRVKAELTDNGIEGSFKFSTTKPTVNADGKVVPGVADENSVLTITAADKGLLGKGRLLGMEEGASNRLNMSTSFLDSGIGAVNTTSTNGKYELEINGTKIEISEKDSVKEIMDKINNSNAGVNVTYQSNTDRFVMTAKGAGASGQIQIKGNVADAMFGIKDDNSDGYKVTEGHDAIIAVKYAGSDETVEIERGSNSFTVDGLNITVKGTFGYKEGATPDTQVIDPTAEAVTFDAKVDSEKTTKAVKEMVEAFNEVLALINTQANTKPSRGYAPLTDEQREGMSESQIEKWEEEAKKGLLFGDSSLKGLEDALRFVLPTTDRAALSKMGITVSTDYADRGKLVFEEEKFKAALEENPDAVKDIFTRQSATDADGTKLDGGFMVKMQTIMNNYASMTGSTKGILVEKAGSVYAPTTILKNSLQKQMDDLDSVIDKLNDKLKTEQDRYIKQFTTLETAISQMNSQSSWLSQFGGGAAQ